MALEIPGSQNRQVWSVRGGPAGGGVTQPGSPDHAPATYLDESEMEALLAAPDHGTAQGRLDYALLLFLYNTSARADEADQAKIADFQFAVAPRTGLSSVLIRAKGNKLRRCPLWPKTVSALLPLIDGRPQTDF